MTSHYPLPTIAVLLSIATGCSGLNSEKQSDREPSLEDLALRINMHDHDRDEAANTDGGLGGGPGTSEEAGFQPRNGASATDAELESLRARARAVRVDGGAVWVNSSGERTENAARLSVAQLAELSTWTQNASTDTLYVHSDGSETIYSRNVAVAPRSETNP